LFILILPNITCKPENNKRQAKNHEHPDAKLFDISVTFVVEMYTLSCLFGWFQV